MSWLGFLAIVELVLACVLLQLSAASAAVALTLALWAFGAAVGTYAALRPAAWPGCNTAGVSARLAGIVVAECQQPLGTRSRVWRR